ncbi:hypothetical protein ILYODFUR_011519 [Ilyodon furcidens]|uniref:Secreted protein n=1 Tax=Ilyodon furcidens TaxID=33524 RepID=A0ABV0SKR9_9TELE
MNSFGFILLLAHLLFFGIYCKTIVRCGNYGLFHASERENKATGMCLFLSQSMAGLRMLSGGGNPSTGPLRRKRSLRICAGEFIKSFPAADPAAPPQIMAAPPMQSCLRHTHVPEPAGIS